MDAVNSSATVTDWPQSPFIHMDSPLVNSMSNLPTPNMPAMTPDTFLRVSNNHMYNFTGFSPLFSPNAMLTGSPAQQRNLCVPGHQVREEDMAQTLMRAEKKGSERTRSQLNAQKNLLSLSAGLRRQPVHHQRRPSPMNASNLHQPDPDLMLAKRASIGSSSSLSSQELAVAGVDASDVKPDVDSLKRGIKRRGTSDLEDKNPHDLTEEECKRLKRLETNRKSAQLSRQRKKARIRDMEVRFGEIERENQQLKLENEKLKKLIDELKGGKKPSISPRNKSGIDNSFSSPLSKRGSGQTTTSPAVPHRTIAADDGITADEKLDAQQASAEGDKKPKMGKSMTTLSREWSSTTSKAN